MKYHFPSCIAMDMGLHTSLCTRSIGLLAHGTSVLLQDGFLVALPCWQTAHSASPPAGHLRPCSLSTARSSFSPACPRRRCSWLTSMGAVLTERASASDAAVNGDGGGGIRHMGNCSMFPLVCARSTVRPEAVVIIHPCWLIRSWCLLCAMSAVETRWPALERTELGVGR
jgi:hypothetical protein